MKTNKEITQDTMTIMISREEEEVDLEDSVEVSDPSEVHLKMNLEEEEVKVSPQLKNSEKYQEVEESEAEEVDLEKILFSMIESSENQEGNTTMNSRVNKTEVISNHKESSESLEVHSEVTLVDKDRKEPLKIDNNSQEVILMVEEVEAEVASEEVSKAPEVEEVASEVIEEVLKDTMIEVNRKGISEAFFG
jgi:hypothetical protein